MYRWFHGYKNHRSIYIQLRRVVSRRIFFFSKYFFHSFFVLPITNLQYFQQNVWGFGFMFPNVETFKFILQHTSGRNTKWSNLMIWPAIYYVLEFELRNNIITKYEMSFEFWNFPHFVLLSAFCGFNCFKFDIPIPQYIQAPQKTGQLACYHNIVCKSRFLVDRLLIFFLDFIQKIIFSKYEKTNNSKCSENQNRFWIFVCCRLLPDSTI